MSSGSGAVLSPLHYISVGIDGSFQSPGKFRTTPAEVDAIIDGLKSSGKKNLTIYFHGGLVSEATGMIGAASLASCLTDTGTYPLMFIWQTGFGETVERNLGDIASTDLFKKLLKLVIRQAAKRLNIDIDSKGGPTSLKDKAIEHELAKDEPFADFRPAVEDTSARGGFDDPSSSEKLIQSEIQASLEEDLASDSEIENLLQEPEQNRFLMPDVRAATNTVDSRGGVLITLATILVPTAWRVISRFRKKRDHGFYPTVVEELLRSLYVANLGKTVWSDMKVAAANMWKPNTGLSDDSQHAGRYLLDSLTPLFGQGYTLNLAGHSAGSIAICKMLEAAASLNIKMPVRNLILLAPACTAEMFWNEIASRPGRFEHFRMFTMQDRYESADVLVPKVFPRSLLYLVSGILEDNPDCPLAGMERHLSGKSPYDGNVLEGVHRFLSEAGTNRVVWSVTSQPGNGLQCSAISHGGFGEDPQLRSSLQFILKP